jgi:hypothetical protein
MAVMLLLVMKHGSYGQVLITCRKVIQDKKETEKQLIGNGASLPSKKSVRDMKLTPRPIWCRY